MQVPCHGGMSHVGSNNAQSACRQVAAASLLIDRGWHVTSCRLSDQPDQGLCVQWGL